MFKTISKLFAVVTICVVSTQTWAGAVVFNLVRDSLDNVHVDDDTSGSWQHSGGRVFLRGDLVGYYATTRRLTTAGTGAYNTAMQTTTLFLQDTDGAPENITLQGAHDFSSGEYKGSVSAASFRYSWLQGALYDGDAGANTLRIQWTGPKVMRVP